MCETCQRPMRRRGEPNIPGTALRSNATTCQTCHTRKARAGKPVQDRSCRWCGRRGGWLRGHCDACTKYEHGHQFPPSPGDEYKGVWVFDPARRVMVPA
jgi:hypothetical protein